MGRYSVAITKDRLSSLIDSALAGEQVVITRHGRPTAELRPVDGERESGRSRAEWGEWLRSRLVRTEEPKKGIGDLVGKMRDEGAH